MESKTVCKMCPIFTSCGGHKALVQLIKANFDFVVFFLSGQNKIVHSDPAVTYMGIMFGVQDRESYGQAVGLRLATIVRIAMGFLRQI